MIRKEYIKEFDVPCKRKSTGEEEIFVVLAYNQFDAQKILEGELSLDWIIGWHSM